MDLPSPEMEEDWDEQVGFEGSQEFGVGCVDIQVETLGRKLRLWHSGRKSGLELSIGSLQQRDGIQSHGL